MAATPKRPADSLGGDDDGFQTVQRKRAKQPTASATDGRAPTSQWRLAAHQEANPYQAITWIEKQHHVLLRVDVSRNGDYFIRGADWAAASTLEEIAATRPNGLVLVLKEATTRGVLTGYPTALPLDPVLEHRAVAAAERCTYQAGHGRRLPTRQVLVTLRGHLPASLDLGCWGVFQLRKFVREPVRCFRCQAFGHHQRQCQREQELCGVCSGDHATRDCIRRLRDGGERPAPRCPNCGDRHHAWNRRCPARLRRIPATRHPRQEAPRPPQRRAPPPAPKQRSEGPRTSAEPAPVPPPPAPPEGLPALGRRRRRRGKRKRRKTKTGADTSSAPPEQQMEVDAVPVPAVETPAAEVVPPAVKERPAAAPSCDQTTQTPARTFTFREADLVSLLMTYEHLVEQEKLALRERCPHEPALSFTRRRLNEGKAVPRTLPVARPLRWIPEFHDHVGEQEYVDFTAEDEEDSDYLDDDTLQDIYGKEDALTDEELKKLLKL